MVRDGFFYALGLGAVAVVLWFMNMPDWLLALPIVLAAFFLWFFRDPNQDDSAGTWPDRFSRRRSRDGRRVDRDG